MLLGCGCNCEDRESVSESINVPSVNTPSSFAPSNSSVSVQSQFPDPYYCGACFNVPTKWNVKFENDWFNLNEEEPSLGYPRFAKCPINNPLDGYTLYPYATPFPYFNPVELYTHCNSWASAETRLDVSDYSCDGQPVYPVCRPDKGLHTLFNLYYVWSYCTWNGAEGTQEYELFWYTWRWFVSRVDNNQVSCVRSFTATYHAPGTTWPTIAWWMPYFLDFTVAPSPEFISVNPI
jgi:hypothetical protein